MLSYLRLMKGGRGFERNLMCVPRMLAQLAGPKASKSAANVFSFMSGDVLWSGTQGQCMLDARVPPQSLLAWLSVRQL